MRQCFLTFPNMPSFDKQKSQMSALGTIKSVGNHCLQASVSYTNVLLPSPQVLRQPLEEGASLPILLSDRESLHRSTSSLVSGLRALS